MKKPIVCLMGPTASGKTPLAIRLVEQFPFEIVSVDSAMVYRGMDIGTAKPDSAILKNIPHHLIDRVEPHIAYSAGQFRREALEVIEEIFARNKIPLLVGGTMLYFRVLQAGLAELPQANQAMRVEIQQRAEKEGWPVLHKTLANIDSEAAKRIHPQDSQRIQRALEVFLLTGQSMTNWQQEKTRPLADYELHNIGLLPQERSLLHTHIATRFQSMLEQGFVAEVENLLTNKQLSADLPSMRAVGYRQMWAYLTGNISFATMCDEAIIATRQLAKRQMTWLRSWPHLKPFTSERKDLLFAVSEYLKQIFNE